MKKNIVRTAYMPNLTPGMMIEAIFSDRGG